MRDIAEERGEFIFTTPERLADPAFLDVLKQRSVSMLVVDEAHCISQWGHDFRPAFLGIGKAIEALGNPRVLALTATATDRVIDDIRRQLSPQGMNLVRTNLYRDNLRYEVIHVTNERERLEAAQRVIDETQGSGIIYTRTVKAAQDLHQALVARGLDVALYHGRLPATERCKSQERFMEGACRLMVATNAFGMGIDKPDIRFVHPLPDAGQPGILLPGNPLPCGERDGEQARCVLLYSLADARVHRFFLIGRYPDLEDVSQVYAALVALGAQARVNQKRIEQQLEGRLRLRKLQVTLRLLATHKVVSLDAEGRYRLVKAQLTAEDLQALVIAYRERAEYDQKILLQMEAYAQGTACRWLPLLSYFNATPDREQCGHCDNCMRRALSLEQSCEPAAEGPRMNAPIILVPSHAIGDTVRVAKHGKGLVSALAADIVTVTFPDGVSRDFRSDYVKAVRARKKRAAAEHVVTCGPDKKTLARDAEPDSAFAELA